MTEIASLFEKQRLVGCGFPPRVVMTWKGILKSGYVLYNTYPNPECC